MCEDGRRRRGGRDPGYESTYSNQHLHIRMVYPLMVYSFTDDGDMERGSCIYDAGVAYVMII